MHMEKILIVEDDELIAELERDYLEASARGFNDRAGVIKNVLDGRAHFVRIDENDVIHILAADAEGLIAHRLHRGTIREETDL